MTTSAAGTILTFNGAILGIVQSVRVGETGAELDITDIAAAVCKLYEAGISEATVDVTVKGAGAANVGDVCEIVVIWADRDTPIAATANAGTDVITTASAHGWSNGDRVRFVTDGGSGVLPQPLLASRTYFVRDKTDTTFKVAETSGGAAINLATAGTATWYAYAGSAECALPGAFVCTGITKSGESGGQITTEYSFKSRSVGAL